MVSKSYEKGEESSRAADHAYRAVYLLVPYAKISHYCAWPQMPIDLLLQFPAQHGSH